MVVIAEVLQTEPGSFKVKSSIPIEKISRFMYVRGKSRVFSIGMEPFAFIVVLLYAWKIWAAPMG